MVETDAGFVLQTVQSPPRIEGLKAGPGAEITTKRLAVEWGLPDFMFHGPRIIKGGSSREVGDALMIIGKIGVVLQVKAREAPSADATREGKWLDKRIQKAERQASGTIRHLREAGAMQLENARGRTIPILVDRLDWLPVVILDHPGVAHYVPTASCLVLLLKDWKYLFEQLKSTRAVADYLRRVSRESPIALGSETVRYHQLAAADAAASPGQNPAGYMVPGAQMLSLPLLSHEPAGADDVASHLVVRQICEDVALSSGFAAVDEADRLDVLAAIDSLPVGYRTSFGNVLLDRLTQARAASPDELFWQFKVVSGGEGPQVLMGVTNEYGDILPDMLATYVSLRHEQLRESEPSFGDRMSVGVILTPSTDRQPPWDTTLTATRGPQSFGPGEREAYEGLWGLRGQGSG